MKKAVFFTGTKSYPAVAPSIDESLGDKELFETVLHEMAVQWSSTGGHPHHKASMAKDGLIVRSEGKIYIQGYGWSVTYTTPEYDAKQAELIANKDWEGLDAFIHNGYTKVMIE